VSKRNQRMASVTMATVCVLTAIASAASAQQRGTSEIELEEITVTARKVAQSLQDTPIAISAFGTRQLKEAGFTNILDVAKAAPGLFIEGYNDRNARVASSPRFRGITVDNSDPLLRTASVFIDGIYVSGGIQGFGVQQLERVEIIKGPQSALFGRNTFAGAINYVSKDPNNEEFSANVSGVLASRGEYRFAASLEGPLSDTLSASFNGSYDYAGGHYDNVNDPGQKLGRESTWSIGATLLFAPSEQLRIKARGHYYEDHDGPAAVARVGGLAEHNFGGFPLDGGGTTETAFRGVLRIPTADEIGANTSAAEFDEALSALLAGGDPTLFQIDFEGLGGYGLRRNASRLSLEVSYEFKGGTSFDMLLGYNSEEYLFFADFDSTPDFGFNTSGGSDLEDISVEARLSGQLFNNKVNWTVGGNYLDIDILTTEGFYDGVLKFWFSGVYAPASRTGAVTKGLFAIVDYQMTDRVKFVFEGRYQHDEIANDQVNVGLLAPISPSTFTKFLPRLVLEYAPSDAALLYVNYSVGNLPGGFNPEVAELDAMQLDQLEADNPGTKVNFAEEKLENYELGWKQYFNDKRGVFNLAAFYMKRSNQIFSGFALIAETDPDAPNPVRTVAFTGNGATTNIYGAELETTINVSKAVSLQGSLAYIDAKISSFPGGAGSGDFGDVFGPDENVAGQRAPRFPKWSWSANATHQKPLSGPFLGMEDPVWFTRADVFYTGRFFDSNTNLASTPVAYDVNLRTGIRNANTAIEFYISNLFGEDAPATANNISDTSFDVRLGSGLFDFSRESIHLGLRRKRQFGLRVNYSF